MKDEAVSFSVSWCWQPCRPSAFSSYRCASSFNIWVSVLLTKQMVFFYCYVFVCFWGGEVTTLEQTLGLFP